MRPLAELLLLGALSAAAANAPALQLDWDDISRLARIDRAKHPEHWDLAPKAE